jgi:Tol biopolymer transport system component
MKRFLNFALPVFIVCTGSIQAQSLSDSVIETAIINGLKSAPPWEVVQGGLGAGARNVQVYSVIITRRGIYNQQQKYYPVKAHVKGSFQTHLAGGGLRTCKFDGITDFRIFKNDYGDHIARLANPLTADVNELKPDCTQPPPSITSSSHRDWDRFWADFRKATFLQFTYTIGSRDQERMFRALMDPNFEYLDGPHPSGDRIDAAFKYWGYAAINGLYALKEIVQKGTAPFSLPGKKQLRIAPPEAANDNYKGWASVFELGPDKRWRWIMHMYKRWTVPSSETTTPPSMYLELAREKILAVSFFLSDGKTNNKQYGTSFPKSKCQYVNWELTIDEIISGSSAPISLRDNLEGFYYKVPSNELFGQNKIPALDRRTVNDVTYSLIFSALGFAQPGNWPVGKYKVKILEAGKFVAEGTFEIYDDTDLSNTPSPKRPTLKRRKEGTDEPGEPDEPPKDKPTLRRRDSDGNAPNASPDLKQYGTILFSSRQSGSQNIYAVDLASGRQTNLTRNRFDNGYPRISPDGKTIAFATNRDGSWQIYVMNPDGSGQRNLTNNTEANGYMDWSPDSQSLVFAGTRYGEKNNDIYIIRADGSGLRRITNDPSEDVHPVWSPDGKHIAFASERKGNRQIYIWNSEDNSVDQMIISSSYDDYPAWSPDGTKIAFASDRDSASSSKLDVYVAALERGSRWFLIDGKPTRMSVIGRKDKGISAVNVSRVVSHASDDRHPTWSPDGKMIAFVSDRDGDRDIFVVNADGTGLRKIVSAKGDDEHPHWTPSSVK